MSEDIGALLRRVAGESGVARTDRALTRRAKQIRDEVVLADLKAAGSLALAGHIMEGVVGLDAHRRALANGDPVTNVLLADIEQQALLAVKKIHGNLYNDWGLRG